MAECPEDLGNFVRFIARRQLPGPDDEIERLTRAGVDWITEHLRSTYPWPGNIRELEQCVRSIMIRRTYSPLARIDHSSGADHAWINRFLSDVQMGRLRTNELLSCYYRLVHEKSGSYLAAGKRLGIDWRSVKERVQASNVAPAATKNGD